MPDTFTSVDVLVRMYLIPIAWRLVGMPVGFGPSRTSRRLLLSDRRVAAAFLERVLAWPFEHVLVAHGEPLDVHARMAFRQAFAGYV